MSWEDQGRQRHGWFGHGTSPAEPDRGSNGRGVGREAVADRMRAVAHGALGALPASLRMGAGAWLDAGTLSRLEVALSAWGLGDGLTPGEFAGRFLGRAADDPIVAALQGVRADAGTGAGVTGRGRATGAPAQTTQGVGPDRGAPAEAAAKAEARVKAAVEAQAAAEKAKNDASQRLAVARSLVRAGGHGTADDVEVVVQHLAAKMSLSELQRIGSLGIYVTVARESVADHLTKYRDMQPGGYDASATWSSVPAATNSEGGFKEIVIATHTGPNGERELPGLAETSSADATLHEVGHTINHREGSKEGLVSDTAEFRRAYDQDAGKGPLSILYYHQPDAAAGRDEAFAESHAEYVSDPETMRVQYPNLYAFWHHRLGDD